MSVRSALLIFLLVRLAEKLRKFTNYAPLQILVLCDRYRRYEKCIQNFEEEQFEGTRALRRARRRLYDNILKYINETESGGYALKSCVNRVPNEGML
jgi:hypothetical protein